MNAAVTLGVVCVEIRTAAAHVVEEDDLVALLECRHLMPPDALFGTKAMREEERRSHGPQDAHVEPFVDGLRHAAPPRKQWKVHLTTLL